MQAKKFLIFLIFVFCKCDALSTDFEPGGKPEIKLINPDAEVVIGAILNVRKPGHGLFGCGERKLEGIIAADALKWMINELNGKMWSGSSANASLGLSIMDSCGRIRTAASQLVKFLPELHTNEKSEEKFPFKFCVIDDMGLENEIDILKSLEDADIAVVETDINITSAQALMNAMLLFIQELRLDHMAIVHSDSRFSVSLLKEFLKSLKKFDFCIPWILNVDETEEEEFKNVIKSGVPVMLLLPTHEHSFFLKKLASLPKPLKKIPIIFSDIVSRSQLKMVSVTDFQIFSALPYPEKEESFENYYSKNSIIKGVRIEDSLDLFQRTRIVRKIKKIGEKISDTLRNATEHFCKENEKKLCTNLISQEGRKFIAESLEQTDWSNGGQLYQLVEYHYQFSDEHIHLHKVMVYNGFKNLDVFEKNFSFPKLNCDGENDLRLECRCLEAKPVRTGLARNIEYYGKKKHLDLQSINKFETVKNLSLSGLQHVNQFLRKPTVFASLNDPLNGTLACLTLLGGLLTLIFAQYFATFAALPTGGFTAGTSVIGYVILIGLFLLFSTNFCFVLTPLISTCAVRRFGTGVSYAMIFSGMLIKVWSSLRQIHSDKVKITKPYNLLFYSTAFTFLQGSMSVLWLLLRPPATEFREDKWFCYPPGDLDTHLLFSMIYPLMLLLFVITLAIRTCSKSNNDETRWILISSSLIAIILSCWGIAVGTGVWREHRTPCTNLSTGTIILICLYIPKIKSHSKLKKALKSQENAHSRTEKETPIFTTSPQYPVILGYNIVAPIISDEVIDTNFVNQAYSADESSETMSTPFDLEVSSYSEPENETYTFSTFLEDQTSAKPCQDNKVDDPTQVVPSTLYPLEIFNNKAITAASDHCQPGTNEFTPFHRATSQLYLCPESEWVP